MRKVIMVKKLLASGEPCPKCLQAQELLERRGLWEHIDEVVWAKEGDASSPGVQLAEQYGVELAPFFIVREPGAADRVYTSTLRLISDLGAAQDSARALTRSDVVELGRSTPGEPALGPPEPALNLARAPADELSAAELAELQAKLSSERPEIILGWGLERFGADCGIAFSGAEDVVLLDLAAKSGYPFRVFCLDTGRLHEETYRFIDRVRAFYGIEVQIFTPRTEPLQELVRKKGLFSFLEDGHSECCGIRKVEPLRRALGQWSAWVTGQRRDQSPTRTEVNVLEIDTAFRGASGRQLLKLNPLALWSSAQVWEYIRKEHVPYNTLHDHGFVSIGCQPCTRPIRPGEHERAARWWWEEATQRECGLHIKKP
jgi:phosphoadenosine phosphosulfate reductase